MPISGFVRYAEDFVVSGAPFDADAETHALLPLDEDEGDVTIESVRGEAVASGRVRALLWGRAVRVLPRPRLFRGASVS